MSHRKLLIILFISTFLVNLNSTCFACWGTRPLAMGGAYTGLSDDVNAIYWNPAGLVLSTHPGITSMFNAGNLNNSNYDDYLAIALPLGEYGTLGAAVVYNKDDVYYTNGSKAGFRRDAYYQIGYANYLSKKYDLSLGVNLKFVTKDQNITTGTDQDNWFDMDFGGLWGFGREVGNRKMFSLGFLVQNATQAQLLKKNVSSKMVRNFRPGMAFHPDEKTTLSLEIYDATATTKNETDDVSRDIRLGLERWVCETIVLRMGGYHVNNADMRAYTGGIGIKVPESWNVNLEVDWTVMHWDKSNSNTHFLGLTYLF